MSQFQRSCLELLDGDAIADSPHNLADSRKGHGWLHNVPRECWIRYTLNALRPNMLIYRVQRYTENPTIMLVPPQQ